jgi:hypothetical protein
VYNSDVVRDYINNYSRSNLYYYIVGIVLFIFSISCVYLSYKYLLQVKKEKENAFIEGSGNGVLNIIANDLKSIFYHYPNSSKTAVISNYTIGKKNRSNAQEVSGSMIYIERNGETIIIDLQPVTLLISSILNENFYYKIIINENIITSNIEDRVFSYSKNYPISLKNFLTVRLSYKPTSQFLARYQKEFDYQYWRMVLFISIVTLVMIPVLFYFLKKRHKRALSNTELIFLNKASELNIQYINSCQELAQRNKFPIIIPVTTKKINRVDLTPIIEEIKIHTLAYTSRFRYKFNLELVSEIKILQVNFDSIVLKQIIFSLLYNILYFMRGGEHIKSFSIKFSKNSISFVYDSFAANEEHMQNWSKGLFKHLANPYILDCQKIFQLLKDCKLNYQVVPNQGSNEVVIYLEQEEELGRVIQFKN